VARRLLDEFSLPEIDHQINRWALETDIEYQKARQALCAKNEDETF
jgi:hypothetical protein